MSEHERIQLELHLTQQINRIGQRLNNERGLVAHRVAVCLLEMHGATLMGAKEGPRRNQ